VKPRETISFFVVCSNDVATRLFSKPHVQQKMLRLADEAWKEHEAGETEEGGFGIS